MGRINFKHFYTDFVEHCFRSTIRKWNGCGANEDWINFTTAWIEMQSEEDKEFILSVFNGKYYATSEGLACYHPEEDYLLKRRRLHNLERAYAIAGGLIDESTTKDR